ncbi:hypothetical protein [Pseudoalteromonas sp. SR43-5]|uniref:hypothetical protein n=1 Tax=Pseudoalteromonas sp. SR43-5 TaxID=2760941 RepID=UPI0015F97100|nr:hypothetical protein [Pseudoalteromonas sp. SR43-5]MBB1304820.1 hypothetical protein [Pseudoalteromonas sp. SR43-5]
MKLLSLLFLLSFNVFGTTCIKAEQTIDIQSSELIDIKVTKLNSGYDVLLHFPEKFNGSKLSAVVMHLGEYGSPIFSTQLEFFRENGRFYSFYTTANGQKPTALISATYGQDCGVEIYKKVP